MARAFLALPGAVALGNPADAASDTADVALHYGAPLREQRAFHTGRAVIDLSHLGVITISGQDRLTWIDSFSTALVRALQPGESCESFILSPQGKTEYLLRLVDDGQTLWAVVDPAQKESVLEFLKKMRFTLRVDVQDRSDEIAMIAAADGAAEEFIASRAADGLVWRDPWGKIVAGGVQYASPDGHPADEYSLTLGFLRRDGLEDVCAALADAGLGVAGLDALRAHEVNAWRPAVADLDDRSLPHEYDWLRTAVHLNKGCYRGQETVAKVHNLGHPPRRLVALDIDGTLGQLPKDRALLYIAGSGADSKPVGRVTRAVLHYEWGPIALALVKRGLEEGVMLEVREAEHPVVANVRTIVPPSAGATVTIPSELRKNQASAPRRR